MNISDFETLYGSREECLRALFLEKHAQYGTNEDVFKNNITAARLAELLPERFLMTNVAKHIAVLVDYAKLLDEIPAPIRKNEMARWRESMDDVSVWMFILNGLLEERFQREAVENGP